MTTDDTTIADAARTFGTAGHRLIEAIRLHGNLESIETWNTLALSGAEPALEVRWVDGFVQIRLGFFTGDSDPVSIYAIALPRPADAANTVPGVQ